MGVFSGTLSYVRYFVEGDLPEDFRTRYLERIQMYATPELTLDNEDEQVHGWASVESILDVAFAPEKVFFDEYILLSFRIDRWKVPPTLLKAYAIEAEKAFLVENQRDKISKRERTQIREKVRLKLKQQVLPTLSATDLCWHPDQGVLRFWTHSSKTNEMMIELFEKTFEVSLVPLSAYTLAERAGLSEEELEQLTGLESEPFSPQLAVIEAA